MRERTTSRYCTYLPPAGGPLLLSAQAPKPMTHVPHTEHPPGAQRYLEESLEYLPICSTMRRIISHGSLSCLCLSLFPMGSDDVYRCSERWASEHEGNEIMPYWTWEASNCRLEEVDAEKFCRGMEGRKGILFAGELFSCSLFFNYGDKF